MSNKYNPPQAYGSYPGANQGYSGQSSATKPNYWGDVQKMKEKYYDSLTSNLLVVFAVHFFH